MEFVVILKFGTFQRSIPILYLYPDGILIHETTSLETMQVMDFIDYFKDTTTTNVMPL